MKRAIVSSLLLVAAALPAVAQAPASAAPGAKLLITGSSTMAPLIEDLAKRFRASHPGVAISVEAGGSGRGVADALAGKADIGMASRELAPKEQALFAIPIARDGVVFAVHRDNPVGALTRVQALEVFSGKIGNWKALGGREGRIEAVTRPPGQGSIEIALRYLDLAPEAIKAAHTIGHNDEVVRLVTANRNAIAFISTGAVDEAMRKGLPIKALVLDGKTPGTGSIRDGTWPMSRPLNLLTRRVPVGTAKAFIEFALSPAARELIVEYDFVPY